jgi:hypothetical protein
MKNLTCIFLFFLFFSHQSLAQSSIFAYQGYLTDPLDQPITGTKSVTFRLYKQMENGSALWTENHQVSVDKGFFYTNLGSISELPSDFSLDQDIYLSVQIEQDREMTPRILIAPSLKAKWADKANQSNLANHAIDVNNENIHPQSVSIGDRLVIDSNGRWVGDTQQSSAILDIQRVYTLNNSYAVTRMDTDYEALQTSIGCRAGDIALNGSCSTNSQTRFLFNFGISNHQQSCAIDKGCAGCVRFAWSVGTSVSASITCYSLQN